MGNALYAGIEYDRTAHDPAFSDRRGSFLDYFSFDDLRVGHDYPFIAAISGIRAAQGMVPLFPLRGLPADLAPGLRTRFLEYFDPGYRGMGWLTVAEVHLALRHANLVVEQLSRRFQKSV